MADFASSESSEAHLVESAQNEVGGIKYMGRRDDSQATTNSFFVVSNLSSSAKVT